MKKHKLSLIIFLIVILLVTACSSPEVEDNSAALAEAEAQIAELEAAVAAAEGSSASAEEPVALEEPAAGPTCDRSDDVYVYGTVLSSIDFFQDTKNGLAAAEQDLGVKTKFVGTAEYDINGLVQALDQAIAEDPAGILILGWEESLVPTIDKAVEAGIPVVTLTADLPTSDRLLFVGADNYQWGVAMGKQLVEMTGGEGTYAVLRDPSLGNVAQRFDGLTDYVSANSSLELVAEENDQSDISIAAQAASAILLQNPDLTAFVALTGVAGPGVATALRDSGTAGQVQVLAVNRDEVVLKAIEDGEITVAFAENPSLEAYYAIKTLDSVRCGTVFVTADDEVAGIIPVPAYIDTGVNIITKDNVEFWWR